MTRASERRGKLLAKFYDSVGRMNEAMIHGFPDLAALERRYQRVLRCEFEATPIEKPERPR
jgi:hypothetical protein